MASRGLSRKLLQFNNAIDVYQRFLVRGGELEVFGTHNVSALVKPSKNPSFDKPLFLGSLEHEI